VAVMIITLSVVNGFKETVSEKVFSFWGHVRIQYRQPMKTALSEEEPIEKNDSLVVEVKKIRGVRAIHPFATKNAILKTEEEIEGILLKGVDSTFHFNNLQSYLQEGRWIAFQDSSYANEIVISTYTARQLKLKMNQSLLIYFVQPDQSMRVRKLKIVGIYKTGIEEYDKTIALADIGLLRRLNNWDDLQIGGYEVFLDNYENMAAASDSIFENTYFPPHWETRTAQELQPNIFDWLEVTNTNSAVLIVIMIIIAVINLITCLIILVLERVQMIGVLKALGASDWSIQKIFLHHSSLITFLGIVLGIGVALLLTWIQTQTGIIRLPEDAYYMDKAVMQVKWWQVAAVGAGTLVISFLVLLIPSLLVKRIQPIKAIHFR
jgi:lipoprotein-releasing system permease protein